MALARQVLGNSLQAGIAGMAEPLMSLVDTAFMGRCGVVSLAALGPNAALFNVYAPLAACVTCTALHCSDAVCGAEALRRRLGATQTC